MGGEKGKGWLVRRVARKEKLGKRQREELPGEKEGGKALNCPSVNTTIFFPPGCQRPERGRGVIHKS